MELDKILNKLSELYSTGERIRIFYGNSDTGSDWMEQCDIMGIVRKSTGQNPIYILIHNKKSSGGGAILTKNIVKITVNKKTVYQHPLYNIDITKEKFTAKRSKFFLGLSNINSIDKTT